MNFFPEIPEYVTLQYPYMYRNKHYYGGMLCSHPYFVDCSLCYSTAVRPVTTPLLISCGLISLCFSIVSPIFPQGANATHNPFGHLLLSSATHSCCAVVSTNVTEVVELALNEI